MHVKSVEAQSLRVSMVGSLESGMLAIRYHITSLDRGLKRPIFSANSSRVASKTDTESVPVPEEMGIGIEKVVDLARQINLEVDSVDVQKLLHSYNEKLTIDELIEMREQKQGIEELEFLDPVQSEDRMAIRNSAEYLQDSNDSLHE
ncbi:hypothetical protein TNCV_3867751 [Trichonephila clavipes]|nr:hypothetical protein TNCV_3867751 [Trichonephila clavipes]